MADGFVKLFSSILDSTVWRLPPVTVKVWFTLMAMADRDGVVHSSVPGLAHRALVSVKSVEQALEIFLSPDPYSRTPDDEGRRIEKVDGGWKLINHGKYRELMSAADRRAKDAERQRKWREKQAALRNVTANVTSQVVTPDNGRHDMDLSLSDPSPVGSGNPDPERARSTVHAVHPLTGHEIQRLFGEIRSRIVGGLPWQSVKAGSGVATSMAEMLNSDPSLRADIRPSIELLFRNAQSGKAGNRSADIVRSPSFAFGAWCDQWTALREELHGVAPEVPGAAPRPPPESFAERDARVKAEQRERERQQTERAVTATDKKAAEYREWTR